jgi:hypothetical protein
MRDFREKLTKLRADAEDCERTSALATDNTKREMFARLAHHLRRMAFDVENVIASGTRTEEK